MNAATILFHQFVAGDKMALARQAASFCYLREVTRCYRIYTGLLRQQNEAEATQMGLLFCWRDKTGTTFGTVPCSHAKKKITAAFRKDLVSFRRLGRRRVLCLVGWESDLRPGRIQWEWGKAC